MAEGIKDYKDAAFKIIFDEPELFVQFLDVFSPVPELKGLAPDAVEDMTERFTMLGQEERDADTVKKIKLPKDGKEMYVISIVEHEPPKSLDFGDFNIELCQSPGFDHLSHVNYRMPFKLLQYMTYIWTEYEREQQREHAGVIHHKEFRYPPILPVVLYDGKAPWTAELSMRGKVEMGNLFSTYIPTFDYSLVNLQDYSLGELAKQNNALSLMLILDKLKGSADVRQIMEYLPGGYLEHLQEHTPERILQVLSDVVRVYMKSAGLSPERMEDMAQQVVKRRFTNMFSVFAENFKQEKEEVRQESLKEGREEGRQEGREEEKQKIAVKLFKKGRSLREVKELVELPDETLAELKKQYGRSKDVPER